MRFTAAARFWVLLRSLFLQLYLQWLGRRRLSEQMIWHYFYGAGGAAVAGSVASLSAQASMAGFDVTFAVVFGCRFFGLALLLLLLQGALLFALLLAGLFACLGDEVFAHGVIGHAEGLPPVGQVFADFGYRGAQV